MSKKIKNVNGYFNTETITKFGKTLAAAREAVKTDADLRVRISGGNIKMGDVPSVSMVPFFSCPGICKKTCGKKCYAAKIANLRPAVLYSYAINQALAMLRPDIYWQSIDLACKGTKFFRFHVSGDILSSDYFEHMIEIVKNNPTTQILCFTKQYSIVNAWIAKNGQLPENLHLLFSGWEEMQPENPYKLPETNVIPKNAPDAWWDLPDETYKMCGGNCFNCACRGLGCWKAKQGETIVFHLH